MPKETKGSYLSDWSEIIQRQGEESRKRDDDTLAEMQERYPSQVEKYKEMTNEELVDHFKAYSQRGCADPRQSKVFQDLAEEGKLEILRRLNK